MEAKPLIALLMFMLALMAAALVIMSYSVTHAPSPYMPRSEADTQLNELRTRINGEASSQQTFNMNTTDQFRNQQADLDSIEDDLAHLMRVNKLPVHKRRGR